MKHCLCIVLLTTVMQLAAKEQKLIGEVSDPAALAAIESYCVDTRQLADDQAYQIRGFLQEESKPHGLLSKLSWKLVPDCREGGPDAMIKVEFPLLKTTAIRLGEPPAPGELPPNLYNIKAVLEVFEGASSKKLYHVQASPLDTREPNSPLSTEDPPVLLYRKALYGAFWALVEDVKRISKMNTGRSSSSRPHGS